jgi:hypothetical protein
MGTGLPTTGDALLSKGRVDIPMGEFWVPLPGQGDSREHPADVREAASAAHIYGKTLAATESFTSMPMIPGWGQPPSTLKPIADRYFALGVNRVLVLPEDVDRLTVPVLRKIRDFVAAGATVVAPKPCRPPSLTGYPASDDEARAIVNDVWGGVDGKNITRHDYGKGKVYWGPSVEEVLAEEKVAPDFQHNRPQIDTSLVWIHRRLGDGDVYFVANQKERAEDVLASFRVDGKEAELWHPDTGAIEPSSYAIENARTTVPLRLDPHGSVFVVFRRTASAPARTLPRPRATVLTTLSGPWNVTFPPNWGAPPRIRLDGLTSWTASTDAGVKYFSGAATYTKDSPLLESGLLGPVTLSTVAR